MMLSPSDLDFLGDVQELFGDMESKFNMDLFPNVADFEDPDMGWLSADSNNNDFEFYPDKYLDNRTELYSQEMLGSPVKKSKSSRENSVKVSTSGKDGGKQQQQRSDKRSEVVSRGETLLRRSPEPARHIRLGGGNPSSSSATNRRLRNQQSEEEDDDTLPISPFEGPQQALSKNAIAARENRMKKKRYIEGLEKSVKSLGSENRLLRNKTEDLEETVEKLQDEVSYLRNVLANVDEVASLVESIRSVNDRVKQNGNYSGFPNQHDYSKVPFDAITTSECSANKRKSESMESYIKVENEMSRRNGKRFKVVDDKRSALGGVCIHVNNSLMSLEFCPRCSASANNSWATKAA